MIHVQRVMEISQLNVGLASKGIITTQTKHRVSVNVQICFTIIMLLLVKVALVYLANLANRLATIV